MAIKILGLIHAGIRIGPSEHDVEKAKSFYGDLLGLEIDETRPMIPTIPGFWLNLDKQTQTQNQQIHIFGAEGMSKAARSDKQDPTRSHVAFEVEDLATARAILKERNVEFWIYESLVGQGSEQLFFEDPFGNMIELQQPD